MFFVLQPITAKIKTSALATKPQTYYIINVVACSTVFSRLIGSFLATKKISSVHGFIGLTVNQKAKTYKSREKTTICNERKQQE